MSRAALILVVRRQTALEVSDKTLIASSDLVFLMQLLYDRALEALAATFDVPLTVAALPAS